MRYMLMFKVDSDNEERGPACKEMPEMGAFVEELMKRGTVIATEGLQPSRKGAVVRVSGGRATVKDGPFTEAKELVAGFVLVEVKSKDEAVELAERFLTVAGGGVSEVREVI
jgi:hypothetical protein